MTIERMVELLEAEHKCMLRKSHGDCDSQCDDCDLVQDDGELHEMYSDVIALLKAQPCKDAVSREAIRELKPAIDHVGYMDGFSDALSAALALPSVWPVPVARVMTLDDIPGYDGAVLVEYTGTFGNPMFEWLLYQVQHNQYVMFSNHNRSNVVFDANDYGKGWRLWTTRPTDVQREATPWES